MIELKHDHLEFSFPDVHPDARLTITFQRTLRIPDNNKTYPLPPGLGNFPIRHVDDHSDRVPPAWLEHGGVMLPMHQAEATWLLFDSTYLPDRGTGYPFAIKVATGKIDAVTGKTLASGLHHDPQDFLVVPGQPWLDGYCVGKGIVRQFVAMPLGEGFTAEEQITGTADHGGLQLMVHPMERAAFDRMFPVIRNRPAICHSDFEEEGDRCLSVGAPLRKARKAMGLAPGGKMKQEIYKDRFQLQEWDQSQRSRCFVHILNSTTWRAVTGEAPPHQPPKAADYTRAGLPWFDYYGEGEAVEGSTILSKLKSVFQNAKEQRTELPEENKPVDPERIIQIRGKLPKHQVREGAF